MNVKLYIFQNGADSTTGGHVMEEMTGMGGMDMMVGIRRNIE